MAKNCYNILEVPETASLEELQRAYRKLAVKYHPDKGSKTSDKFRDLTEAYNEATKTLGSKRLHKPARSRHGSDISISLKVSLNEIVSETPRTIITTRTNNCSYCNGSGSSSKEMLTCPKCNGSGIDVISSMVGPKKFCSYCKGYGDIPPSNDCKKCNGIGLVKEKIQRTIKISRENKNIIIKESGNYPPGGGTPGDLIISVYSDNNLFEISGKNINGTISLSPAQAVLGDIIFMDVFGNIIKVTIPPGTKPGDILEQNNTPIGPIKGTLFLKTSIDIPIKITEEEKNLYKQLLKLQKGFL